METKAGDSPEPAKEPGDGGTTLKSLPPSYFAGRVVEGENWKTGERFVIEMTERGSVVISFYEKDDDTKVSRTDNGRWWMNMKDRVCFEFNRVHQGEKFCRIYEAEGDGEWLTSGDPSKPKWRLHPR